MIIILFTLFVIIVVSILGIEEDLDCYEEFNRKKKREERGIMMIYFKEYNDEFTGSAVGKLNEDIKNSEDNLINAQYQVIRYEVLNLERTYILAQWEVVEKNE